MAVLETTDIKRPTQRDQLTELDAADAFVIEDRTDSKLKYIEKSDLTETLGIDENTANIATLKSDDTTEGSVLKAIKDTAENATFTPTGNIEATNIKDAITELDIEKEPADNTILKQADVVNSLTTGGTTVPLSAEQGKILGEAITKRYGVRMTKSSGTNVRLYDAATLTYRRQVDTISTPSDFSAHYPWSGIKTVKVDADGNILSVIGNANWDTTVGDIMVLIPKFYSKKWEDDLYEYSVISTTQHEDYLPVGFINPDGTEKPFTLVGAFLTSNDGTTPHSYTDTIPKYSHPLYNATSGFQLDAMNKSEIVNWSNIDHQTWEMLTRLMCIEIGSNNVKTLIGQGINGLSNSYSALNVCTVATTGANTFIMAKTRSQYFAVGMMVQIGTAYTSNNIASNRYITDISGYDETNDIITVDGTPFTTTTSSTIATWGQPLPESQLLALGNESGYVLQFGAQNKSHVCYRGIWDLWGNMWQFMSGLYRYDLQFYACFDVTKMNVNDPRVATGWIATNIVPDLPNGYLKERQTYKHPLGEIGLPAVTGGTGVGSTTWWAAYLDYFNSSYMGLRAVRFGGNWDYGAIVSPFYWNGYDSPTSTLIRVGGRLIL